MSSTGLLTVRNLGFRFSSWKCKFCGVGNLGQAFVSFYGFGVLLALESKHKPTITLIRKVGQGFDGSVSVYVLSFSKYV